MKTLSIYLLCAVLLLSLTGCIKDGTLDKRALDNSSLSQQVSSSFVDESGSAVEKEDKAAGLIMKDATNLTRQGDDIRFFIANSLEDIRGFYRNQLKTMEAEGRTLPECDMPGATTWGWIGEYDDGKVLKIDAHYSGLEEVFEVLIYCEQ